MMDTHHLYLYTQYHIIVEAMAAVTGLLTWNKWKKTFYKWFIIYLTVVFLFELRIHFSLYYKMHESLSFIIVPLEIIFINYFFYQVIQNKWKKIILVGSTSYITTWLIEEIFIKEKSYYFQSISYTLGNLFILVYLIIFFIEFVNSEKILNFNKQASFWIALGMLLFYLGTFPFYGLYNEIMKNMNIFLPYAWIVTSLNYIMYIFFTIGLIWAKPD